MGDAHGSRWMLVCSALVEEDDAVEDGIRYAHNSGVAIAYQVVGEGAIDLVYVPDWMSNLVYGWESPCWRAFYERLAQSFRLILFDKRGTGLSDHGANFATLETRMEDLRAVLDAAGAPNPVVLGSHEGCGMAVLLAATYRFSCSDMAHRRCTPARMTGIGTPTGYEWARVRRLRRPLVAPGTRLISRTCSRPYVCRRLFSTGRFPKTLRRRQKRWRSRHAFRPPAQCALAEATRSISSSHSM